MGEQLRFQGRSGSGLLPVVDDQGLFQVGSQERAEGGVRRVGQVGVAVGCAGEGDEEAVAEAVGLAFDADIGAPLKVVDDVDLPRQRAEGVLDFGDLGGGCAVFELEEDDMTH